MRTFLCLLLVCGSALARSTPEAGLPGVQADIEEPFAGEGHGRQLSGNLSPGSGSMEVEVNPGLVCNDYPRAADEGANAIFRQAAQELTALLAGMCDIPTPSSGKYLAQISTLCKADPKTKQAKSILVSAKTVPLDDKQLECFAQIVQLGTQTPAFACYVNILMASASPEVARWAPPVPSDLNCKPPAN